CPFHPVWGVCTIRGMRSSRMIRHSLGKTVHTAYARPMLAPMASPQEFPPVLTAALAAELLQVHVEYLRKMVREGRVPCHRFPGGGELRCLRAELLEWLSELPGQPDPSLPDQSLALRTHATDAIRTEESPASRARTRTRDAPP